MTRKSPIARIGAVIPDGRSAGIRGRRVRRRRQHRAATQTSAEDVKPVAQIDNLTGVDTAGRRSTLASSTRSTKLKVTPGPVGDAEISKDGVASFPITGGNVIYYDPSSSVRPYVQGVIDHEGSGLSLTAGKTEVELTDFVIDPGTSELTGTVSVNGKEAATDALLFDLDGSTLEPLKTNSDGTATLEGTTVRALRRRGEPAERHVRDHRPRGRSGGRHLGASPSRVSQGRRTDAGGRGPFLPGLRRFAGVQPRGLPQGPEQRELAGLGEQPAAAGPRPRPARRTGRRSRPRRGTGPGPGCRPDRAWPGSGSSAPASAPERTSSSR